MRAGVVTFPTAQAGVTPISQLLDIVCSIGHRTVLVAGGEGYEKARNDPRIRAYRLDHPSGSSALSRAFHYFQTQAKMALTMLRESPDVDAWLFFIGGDTLLLPMVAAKVSGKKVMLIFAGSNVKTYEAFGDGMSEHLRLLSGINCSLSDAIVVYTPCLIKEYDLGRYAHKVRVAHRHYVDLDLFKITVPFEERGNVIGYIGRLSEEKGIVDLIKALGALTDAAPLLIVAGDGQLREVVSAMIEKEGLQDRVSMIGWVSREGMPDLMNKLRLLVMPSRTEGLPNVMLEAMACGTPVLATAVGSIPDVIVDGETGFLLTDGSPESIGKGISNALSHPRLAEISAQGSEMVRREFTLSSAIGRWKRVLEGI